MATPNIAGMDFSGFTPKQESYEPQEGTYAYYQMVANGPDGAYGISKNEGDSYASMMRAQGHTNPLNTYGGGMAKAPAQPPIDPNQLAEQMASYLGFGTQSLGYMKIRAALGDSGEAFGRQIQSDQSKWLNGNTRTAAESQQQADRMTNDGVTDNSVRYNDQYKEELSGGSLWDSMTSLFNYGTNPGLLAGEDTLMRNIADISADAPGQMPAIGKAAVQNDWSNPFNSEGSSWDTAAGGWMSEDPNLRTAGRAVGTYFAGTGIADAFSGAGTGAAAGGEAGAEAGFQGASLTGGGAGTVPAGASVGMQPGVGGYGETGEFGWEGGMPGGPNVVAGSETALAGTALERLLNGKATDADYISLLGNAGATALSMYGDKQARDQQQAQFDQFFGMGKPLRDTATGYLQDPSSYFSGPVAQENYRQMGQSLSKQSNPAGSPYAQTIMQQGGNRDYFNTINNLFSAGMGGTPQAYGAGQGAISEGKNMYSDLGLGISGITNPRQKQPSFAEMMARWASSGGGV